MGGIIYDARRIKAYEYMQGLGAMTGKPQDFIDSLWKEIVMDGDLMKEFAYYLDHHTFLNEFKVNGYGFEIVDAVLNPFSLRFSSFSMLIFCKKSFL